MILDAHVHIMDGPVQQAAFLGRLQAASIDGAVLLSSPPASFRALSQPASPAERLATLMEWVKGQPLLYPFYWIDPVEPDAVDQVTRAVAAGVSGFKVICNRFYPGDPRAMPVYRAIADANRPLLFHSGILWDGADSSRYNRPAEWEAMLDVPRLRFALAHISWPWVDESLALFGKLQAAFHQRPELSCEMYIDLTPGTPRIYRQEALTKVFTIGYKVADRILFGTDGVAGNYNVESARYWLGRDQEICERLELPAETRRNVFADSLVRFLGQAQAARCSGPVAAGA